MNANPLFHARDCKVLDPDGNPLHCYILISWQPNTIMTSSIRDLNETGAVYALMASVTMLMQPVTVGAKIERTLPPGTTPETPPSAPFVAAINQEEVKKAAEESTKGNLEIEVEKLRKELDDLKKGKLKLAGLSIQVGGDNENKDVA